jgi:hypothetical protein
VREWFGTTPAFHDATLAGLDIALGVATIRLNAFRMTDVVDDKGFFVLDRKASVTITVSDVTGISLSGDAQSIISELAIRRLAADRSDYQTVAGPCAGNYEVRFEASYGLEGSIFGRDLTLSLAPEANPGK